MIQQEKNEGKDSPGGKQCVEKHCGVNQYGLLDDSELISVAK